MARRTLTPNEAVAQLTRRSSIGVAPAARMRALASDAADAVNVRRAGKAPDVVWRHKYHVGQTVTLTPTRYGAHRQGGFEVTCLLPQEHGINKYRLRSQADGHDRVANEDELT